MAGVTKKFGINFPKKTMKKKGGDELDVPTYKKLSSLGSLSPNLSQSHQPLGLRSSKTSSMGSINTEIDTELDHDDMMSLTQNVRAFSEALQGLKAVVLNEKDDNTDADNMKVATLDKLGEVLHILKGVLLKYPVLQSTDVLTASAVLMTRVKSFNYEELRNDGSELLHCIDQLALAFSSSVSEYLNGDTDSYPKMVKSKSYDNISDKNYMNESEQNYESLTAEEIDSRLHQYEKGMDVAFFRAKAWSSNAKNIAYYVEKRAHFESELSKNLLKLTQSVKDALVKDTFLPFQSIYCTALDQDFDFANRNQEYAGLIQTSQFIEPLNMRRAEHEKLRKSLKDRWAKEIRRMQEAIANLKKAKSMYISRQQEHEKAKELAQKAESDLSQSTGASASKAKKKKVPTATLR